MCAYLAKNIFKNLLNKGASPLICIDLSNIERIFLFSLFHGAVCGEQNGQQTDG